MAAIEVVRVRPGAEPRQAILAGALAPRIHDYATQHEITNDAATYVRDVMVRLWQDDPAIYLAALVTTEGEIMGHLLAWYHGSVEPKYRRLFIAQAKGDGNVGDGLKQAIADAETWGRGLGATSTVVVTHRHPDAWKKQGFDVTHTVCQRIYEGGGS
jgi:hypothetical protein